MRRLSGEARLTARCLRREYLGQDEIRARWVVSSGAGWSGRALASSGRMGFC